MSCISHKLNIIDRSQLTHLSCLSERKPSQTHPSKLINRYHPTVIVNTILIILFKSNARPKYPSIIKTTKATTGPILESLLNPSLSCQPRDGTHFGRNWKAQNKPPITTKGTRLTRIFSPDSIVPHYMRFSRQYPSTISKKTAHPGYSRSPSSACMVGGALAHFAALQGTGAGTTAQETPEITFSEKARIA